MTASAIGAAASPSWLLSWPASSAPSPGSGPATVAALGIILIPAMINRGGFSAPFASSLMASASSIAIVIPPSIAFVVYASITGVSVGDMFMGGWIPGIMMGLSLVIIIMIECRKKGIQASKAKSSWGQRWKSFREAFWGFLMPVIIIGGIYGGVFTPTRGGCRLRGIRSGGRRLHLS